MEKTDKSGFGPDRSGLILQVSSGYTAIVKDKPEDVWRHIHKQLGYSVEMYEITQ